MLSSDFSWQVHHPLTGMVVRERLGRYLTPSIRIVLKSRNMLQERGAGVQCICDGGGSRLVLAFEGGSTDEGSREADLSNW
jgi:hypothetical protein